MGCLGDTGWQTFLFSSRMPVWAEHGNGLVEGSRGFLRLVSGMSSHLFLKPVSMRQRVRTHIFASPEMYACVFCSRKNVAAAATGTRKQLFSCTAFGIQTMRASFLECLLPSQCLLKIWALVVRTGVIAGLLVSTTCVMLTFALLRRTLFPRCLYFCPMFNNLQNRRPSRTWS